jgi:phosphoheptose isomerase
LVSQIALNTAFINDISADMVFAQQVFGYGKEGDCLLGISTSGKASNVVNAVKVANVLGLETIGLTGRTGGYFLEYCTVTIRVPWDETPMIQERHLPIIHTLCAMLEDEFFSS